MEEAFYRTVYEIEKTHWWCVARQRIVEDVIDRRIELPAGAQVLDVGCGSGAVLEALSARFEAYGTDTSQLAIDLCRQRGLPNAFCCTLETFPRKELRFDLVTLLDVVEHVDDDLGILREAQRYVKTGGWTIVTVPAYQFLWGPHDVVNHHKRRYTRAGDRPVLPRFASLHTFLPLRILLGALRRIPLWSALQALTSRLCRRRIPVVLQMSLRTIGGTNGTAP